MIPSLKTARLLLRQFHPNDAAAVQRLAGHREIADTTMSIPHPYDAGMASAWIAMHEPAYAEGTAVDFAVVRKEEEALVGAISLIRIEKTHQAELGYWIGKPYWNRGFCTEAAEALLAFAFEELRLVRIHARHLSRNPASGRVMQKLGMRHEGTLRKHALKWGLFEDLEVCGILAEEWRERRVPEVALGS